MGHHEIGPTKPAPSVSRWPGSLYIQYASYPSRHDTKTVYVYFVLDPDLATLAQEGFFT